MNSKLFHFVIFLLTASINIQAKVIENDEGCTTKKLQIMKPTFPSTDYQGYGVVTFNINENGSVSRVRAKESQCAISRNSDGSIKFKSCPFFKKSLVDAAKYLKYSPPVTKDGTSCTFSTHFHRYTYSWYNVDFEDNNQFLFSDEVDLLLKQNFQSNEDEELYLRKIITGKLQ
jgi:hypothetical protein